MEGLCDLRVDVDELVILDEQGLVALVDLLSDPVGEDDAEQGVADVGDPLLGQLRDLLRDRQVVAHEVVRSVGNVECEVGSIKSTTPSASASAVVHVAKLKAFTG